jgi:hypothetical protein
MVRFADELAPLLPFPSIPSQVSNIVDVDPLFLELAQYPPALQLTHDAFGCGAFHLCQSNFIARPKESPEHARMDFVSG